MSEEQNTSTETNAEPVVQKTIQEIAEGVELFNTPEEPEQPEQEEIQEEAKPSEEQQTEEEQDNNNLSARFAAMTRKERALREKETALKEQTQKVEKFEQAITNAKDDPIQAIEALGVTYEDLTDAILRSVSDQPEDEEEYEVDEEFEELRAEVEALKKEREEEKQAFRAQQETEQREYIDASIGKYKEFVRETINSDPETYEVLANYKEGDVDGAEVVFGVVAHHYAETGEILSPDQVLPVAEQILTEQLKEKYSVLSKISKFKGKSEESEQSANLWAMEESITPPVEDRKPTKDVTLTNKQLSSVWGGPKANGLTDEQRKAQLAKRITWE